MLFRSAGVPDAVAEKTAFAPLTTPMVAGFAVIRGAKPIVRAAAVVVDVPPVFVNAARYRLPSSPAPAVKLSVVDVAPGMLLNVAPPSELTCHCTVGVGVPVAAAVKVAVPPEITTRLAGFAVMTGAPGTEIRPMLLALCSVNHIAPSGPAAMPEGALLAVGMVNSVMTPAVVILPILLPSEDANQKIGRAHV